jgi:hydrogenase nickel incorporation protein HypA/HybF
MHETGLVRDLIRRIELTAAANGGGRVRGVRVWIGALTQFSASHFREHFEDESRGTIAEGALLAIVESDDEADPRAQSLLLESIDIDA